MYWKVLQYLQLLHFHGYWAFAMTSEGMGVASGSPNPGLNVHAPSRQRKVATANQQLAGRVIEQIAGILVLLT
jgi:hypothetical protein